MRYGKMAYEIFKKERVLETNNKYRCHWCGKDIQEADWIYFAEDSERIYCNKECLLHWKPRHALISKTHQTIHGTAHYLKINYKSNI